MTWSDFFTNFSSELIATFIGIIFGIPAGIWLNNLIEKKRKKNEKQEEEKTLTELRGIILSQIYDEINMNVMILKKMESDLPDNVPIISLKTSTWKSFSIRELVLLQDISFSRRLFELYFVFEDIIKLINRLFNLSYTTTLTKDKTRIIEQLANTINDIILFTLNECKEISEKIKLEIPNSTTPTESLSG